jgi:hypothetical protein
VDGPLGTSWRGSSLGRDIGALVGVRAQVEHLRGAQHRERLEPYLQRAREALFHEHQLPVLVPNAQHITVVGEVAAPELADANDCHVQNERASQLHVGFLAVRRFRGFLQAATIWLADDVLDRITGAVEHRREQPDGEIQLRRFHAGMRTSWRDGPSHSLAASRTAGQPIAD